MNRILTIFLFVSLGILGCSRGETEYLEAIAKWRQQGKPTCREDCISAYQKIESGGSQGDWDRFLSNEQILEARTEWRTIVAQFDGDRDAISLDTNGEWLKKREVVEFLKKHKPLRDELRSIASLDTQVRLPWTFWEGDDRKEHGSDSASTQHLPAISELLFLDGQAALAFQQKEPLEKDIIALLRLRSATGRIATSHALHQAIDTERRAIDLVRRGLQIGLFHESALKVLDEEFRKLAQVSRELKSSLEKEIGFLQETETKLRASGSNKLIWLQSSFEAIEGVNDHPNSLYQLSRRLRDRLEDSLAKINGRREDYLALEPIQLTAFALERHARLLTERNLARLAVATIHERLRSGNWPKSLEETKQTHFQNEELAPIGPNPFGYSIESDHGAILWGIDQEVIDIRRSLQVPLEKPPIVDAKWIWRLQMPTKL